MTYVLLLWKVCLKIRKNMEEKEWKNEQTKKINGFRMEHSRMSRHLYFFEYVIKNPPPQ